MDRVHKWIRKVVQGRERVKYRYTRAVDRAKRSVGSAGVYLTYRTGGHGFKSRAGSYNTSLYYSISIRK